MSVDRQLITANFLTMLAAGTGKPVGDHKAPDGVLPWRKDQPKTPYSVLYAIPGGGSWGPGLVDPDRCADFVYQVDSVAASREQCDWLADRVRRSVLNRTTTGGFQVGITDPVGWKVADREPSGSGGVQVEGDRDHEVFSVAERFTLRVVPA